MVSSELDVWRGSLIRSVFRGAVAFGAVAVAIGFFRGWSGRRRAASKPASGTAIRTLRLPPSTVAARPRRGRRGEHR